jgi:hypothetical protein
MLSRKSGQIAVIGIDIGKNFSQVVGLDKRLFCGRNGRVGRLKPGWRICHHASRRPLRAMRGPSMTMSLNDDRHDDVQRRQRRL